MVLSWLIGRYLSLVLAVWVAAQLVPGVEVDTPAALWSTAFLLGLFNFTLKPILLFFTLPITIATYGLAALLVNALLFWLAAHMLEGITVTHFFAAVLASAVISLVSTLTWWFMHALSPRHPLVL